MGSPPILQSVLNPSGSAFKFVDSIHTKGESDITFGMTVAFSQISLVGCDWIVVMTAIRTTRIERIF